MQNEASDTNIVKPGDQPSWGAQGTDVLEPNNNLLKPSEESTVEGSGEENSTEKRPAEGVAYKEKVMEDLDALLADLQNTTARISTYQSSQQQQQPQSQVYYNQDQPLPPNPSYTNPRPPDPNQSYQTQSELYQRQQSGGTSQGYRGANPSENLADPGAYRGYETQGYYQGGQGYYSSEGQGLPYGQGREGGAVVTVTRESYHSSDEQRSGSSTPPPLPPPPPSEILDSLVNHRELDSQPIYEQQTFHVRESSPASSSDFQLRNNNTNTRGERMSALSSNLSELDQLLQDLNSAQFLAEVDRKSSNGGHESPVVVNGGSSRAPPPVAPKPGQRTSVDNLLDQLEEGPPPGKFPVDPLYQEVTPVRGGGYPVPASTSYHQQQQHHQLPPAQTASSATKDLDELMMSLSEFKLQNKGPHSDAHADANQEPAYAKPVKSQSLTSPKSPPAHGRPTPQPEQNGPLESMLGDLQSDMSKQGVNIKQKGVCAACNKPIVGQVIAALGRTWHVEHFVCAHCDEPLGTRNFYERDSKAYCENDYYQLFAPRCAYCNGPIVDKCITALEKMWHPEHFFCAQCGRLFGEEDFHENNGKAYCKEDYFQLFAPKCGGCAMPIMDNYISALNRQWHPQCFVCWDCQVTFGSGNFFDYEGLPYCETHYHAKKGSLCASCDKPITGRCITAMFKKFHPEHFVCAFCLKQLNKGTFKEQNDKPYCHPCFVKLFG